VLHGHSWGALIVVAYAQEHPDHVAALVLSAPGDLPLGGAQPVPGDLTTRLDSAQKAQLYLRLMQPRNLFGYALTSADARVAHSLASDREMDRRFPGQGRTAARHHREVAAGQATRRDAG
jgi:pimeloyl-ACP methyl ester carboxylesterase